jgi:hypothetical protein
MKPGEIKIVERFMKLISDKIRIVAFIVCAIFVASCQQKEELFSEPYEEGKAPLGIVMNPAQTPVPAFGLPGSSVTVKATGLAPYKDRLVFRINGEPAQITEITDTEIKATVPDNASTGVISLSVEDVVVFGPKFDVVGKVNLDPTFQATRGANGQISRVYPTPDGKQILIGNFTNYDNKGIIRPINRIVRTFPDGTYDASLRTGRGANGFLASVIKVGDKFFIGGSFSGYDQRGENISNITRLNENGTIDTMGVSTFRRPDQSDTTKYFPTFNGGFNSHVNGIYEQNGKLLVTGTFRYYVTRTYDQPNKLEVRDTVILDSTEVRQIARLNTDGTLDKSYRFDVASNKSLPGGNGNFGSVYHTEGDQSGRMLLYGTFTSFDGQPKNYLVRLNPDGTIDETFNASGAGPDFEVGEATYNPVTKKYLITGNFRTYNGKPVHRIALLNEDGTLDESFIPKEFLGGGVGHAKQLNDGKVVVTGSFKTYGGIARNGFMILESNGNLASGYNATGLFSGYVSAIYETQSADEKRALLIVGAFWQFNSQPVNNIIRVTLD